MIRVFWRLLLLAVVLLLGAEGVARWLGIADFPVYEVRSDYGYIPRANQSGAFLRHNRWIFNERSMATGPYTPHQKTDILMIGDSVVIGGNPLDQAQRLGTQLAAVSGGQWAVWPIGGASWSALNEMAWMDQNADVVADCRWIVWSINSGDFYEFSHWVNDEMQPRFHPSSAFYYAWKKFIWDPQVTPLWQHWLKHATDFPAYPTNMMSTFPIFKDYLPKQGQGKFKGKLLIMLYPAKPELGNKALGWVVLSQKIKEVADASQVELINIADEPLWNEGCYRDFIHPNPTGNKVLAEILQRKIQSMEVYP